MIAEALKSYRADTTPGRIELEMWSAGAFRAEDDFRRKIGYMVTNLDALFRTSVSLTGVFSRAFAFTWRWRFNYAFLIC